jgi:hypothetical protein
VSGLRGKFARLVALLVLMAGLAGAAAPGFAAAPTPEPRQPLPIHADMAGMDCDAASHKPAPKPHVPAAGDCCLVSICAMNLALLTLPSGLAGPELVEMPPYDRDVMRQPPGIVTAPVPHPPKAGA